ncbi:MAG: cytochrome c [Methylococcales bacterium]|nr:cytochrome c [Methylococcales bacterium]
MKKSLGTLAGIVLIALSGSALADEQLEIGQKIYDRAFGRGCGTCHDIASNPQLPALIKAGQLDRAKFEQVLRDGKGGMPKAMDEIMKNKAVEKAGYTEELAIDALYKYISSK